MHRQDHALRLELRRAHRPTHGALDLRDRRVRETARVDIQRTRAKTFRGRGGLLHGTHRVALRPTLANALSSRRVWWHSGRLDRRQLGGGQGRGRTRRETGHLTHAQQREQAMAGGLWGAYGLFSILDVGRHPFTFRLREGPSLEVGEGERATPVAERQGGGADQPLFEHPHTAETARIEIRPVLEESRTIDRERHLCEEGQQHIPKGLAIGLDVAVIAWKVDLQAPTSGLAIQITKMPQAVGPQ